MISAPKNPGPSSILIPLPEGYLKTSIVPASGAKFYEGFSVVILA